MSKTMNIRNTMCRISELTQEQIDSLLAAMPNSSFFLFSKAERFIGFTKNGSSGTWFGNNSPTILTYNEMMQLLGKSLGFTKSDLIELAKTKTVFVKRRDESYRIYIGGIFTGDGWVHPDSYNEGLKHQWINRNDIMSVYVADRHEALIEQLKGIALTQVWVRTELTLTPEQKQMEDLKKQAAEIVKDGVLLKLKMEALQAGIDSASKL